MIKQKFQSESGKVFNTQAEAEQHDLIRAAADELSQARRNFTKKVAQSQLTKDGRQFNFSKTYYLVHDIFDARIETIDFYAWKVELDERDMITIGHMNHDGKWRSYRICELYVSELEAKKELYRALEERIHQRCEELNSLGEKIGIQMPPIIAVRAASEVRDD